MKTIGSATRTFPKVAALPVHHLTPPNPPASAKNIELDRIVVVYKVTEILHRPGFDNPIRVVEDGVCPVSHSSGSPKPSPNEDLPDDYLEMLSSKFPESDLLPKVHPR